MEKFFALFAMAILIEGIVTYVRELSTNFKAVLLAPIVLSVVVAIAYGLDIPAVLGISAQVPYIGSVLTGIIIARGSNYLFDVVGRLTQERPNAVGGLAVRTQYGYDRK